MAFKDVVKKIMANAKTKDPKPAPVSKVDEKLVGQKEPKLDSKTRNAMLDRMMKGKA